MHPAERLAQGPMSGRSRTSKHWSARYVVAPKTIPTCSPTGKSPQTGRSSVESRFPSGQNDSNDSQSHRRLIAVPSPLLCIARTNALPPTFRGPTPTLGMAEKAGDGAIPVIYHVASASRALLLSHAALLRPSYTRVAWLRTWQSGFGTVGEHGPRLVTWSRIVHLAWT